MSIRPTISHIIGISGLCYQAFQEEIHVFFQQHSEDNFVDISKNVWDKLEKEDEFYGEYRKNYETKRVYDFFYHQNRTSNKIFGIHPVFHYEESSLFNHDLIWCMMEANLLKEENGCFKLPYDDYSHVQSVEEIKNLTCSIGVKQELRYYDGNWGRKYLHTSLSTYDDDFDFAFQLFHELNIPIKKNDLDRYLIINWE